MRVVSSLRKNAKKLTSLELEMMIKDSTFLCNVCFVFCVLSFIGHCIQPTQTTTIIMIIIIRCWYRVFQKMNQTRFCIFKILIVVLWQDHTSNIYFLQQNVYSSLMDILIIHIFFWTIHLANFLEHSNKFITKYIKSIFTWAK